MKTNHTSGLWKANLGYTPTVTVGETLLCVPSATADEIGGRQLSELHANARLMAAAPELLAACEAAKLALRATSKAAKDYSSELELLNAAIAKATGA